MSRNGVRIRGAAAMAVGCVVTVAGCQLLVGLHGVELVEPDAGPDAGLEAGPDAEPDAKEGGATPGNLGGPCGPDGSCANQAVCVAQDDVCCATLCGLKCEACAKVKTGQANGTCAPVLLGEDPDNECADAGGCGMSNQCRCQDGVKDGDETDVDCGGTCQPCNGGAGCVHDTDCASDVPNCAKSRCCTGMCGLPCEVCNSVGTACVIAPPGYRDSFCPAPTVCSVNGPTGCVGTASAPCTAGIDCLSGVCTGGICAKSQLGGPCSASFDCATGTCQNYVCM